MGKQVEDILFEYLRDIIFSPEKASLDVSELPEQFQQLGEGLLFLSKCILENKQFVSALAKGNISVMPPAVDNMIAAPAKALQGALRHVTWQTAQVAKGDYGQQIDFMGEFSHSFNLMVRQLAERTRVLEAEREKAIVKNEELSQVQDLFLAMLKNSPEIMVLLDIESNSEYLISQSAENLKKEYPSGTEALRQELMLHSRTYHGERDGWDLTVSALDDKNPPQNRLWYYYIDSFPIFWKGRKAMLHIIRDRTAEEEKEQQLVYDSFNDPLTGLFNRRYAMGILEEWYEEKRPFCISMVDVDHLKYCNDIFGHEAGDGYLLDVCKALSHLPKKYILCRIGGDEFLILAPDATEEVLNDYIEEARDKMVRGEVNENALFLQSFSYGTCGNLPISQRTLSEILKEADVRMYRYKMNHKPRLKDASIYQDDRVETEKNSGTEAIG